MTPVLPLPIPLASPAPLIQDITSLIEADSHINFVAWRNVEPGCHCYTQLYTGETTT